jgi:protein SCO1/2
MFRCVLSVLSAAVLFGCAAEPSAKKQASSQPESGSTKTNDQQIFEARGIVQEVKPEKKQVVIKHENITNYMPAMTMPFDVKQTNELAGLSSGDQVTFQLVVTKDDGWVQNLQRIGVSSNAAPEHQSVRLVRDVEPLKVGDVMPDYSFTNSLGKRISLSDFKGEALAFTFIFTRCPFPLFCPKMSRNFEESYETLMKMPNAPPNWHLISISFDPEHDTPAVLKAYSAAYNPDPKKWDFATGAMIDIDAITEQFGLYFAFNKGNFDHNLRTVVIDASGKVQQIFIGNDWKPQELVDELIKGTKAK